MKRNKRLKEEINARRTSVKRLQRLALGDDKYRIPYMKAYRALHLNANILEMVTGVGI
jgi:hypothetical protein